jgi:hypothetical protein
MIKEKLNEINELEMEAVKKFIETQSPNLGINSVILTLDESYVVITEQ